MTRGTPPGRGDRPARRTTGDPYGLAAARPFVAPLLSFVGLVVIAFLTLAVLSGNIPFLSARSGTGNTPNNPNPGGPVVPGRTPSPSAPPVVNPDAGIDGRLVYAKAGNLWIQGGTQTTQLTTTGRDSQPSWSADGAWIYFIDTRRTTGLFPRLAGPEWYDLHYPVLTRIHPDGTNREVVLSGLYRTGPRNRYSWAYFIRDPAVAPDGRNVAVVSDGPDPTKSDVVLGLVSVARQRLSPMGLPENAPFGHQDPAWSPDGKQILYVRNARDGARGAPTIWRYDLATKKNVRFGPAGYVEPLYSPDGRYLVATKTSTLGTEIVVLDARNSNELLRVTSDGRSWGGAWSPDGTQIAFLHLVGATTDLQLATLASDANGGLSVTKIEPLTEFSGLDPASRPAWWGPRPTPTPTPMAPNPTSSAGPSASSAP
jgi:dipeptidyl aminopeptidase/acylaminoacyl peptidase